MCEPSSVFLILNRLSVATFFRQMTSSVLASFPTLPPVLSVLVRTKNKPWEEKKGGKVQSQIGTQGWERDIKRLDGEGWVTEYQGILRSPRSRSIWLCTTETTTSTTSTREPNNLCSCIVHYLLKETAWPLCFLLSPSLSETIIPYFISGERENRACSLLSP